MFIGKSAEINIFQAQQAWRDIGEAARQKDEEEKREERAVEQEKRVTVEERTVKRELLDLVDESTREGEETGGGEPETSEKITLEEEGGRGDYVEDWREEENVKGTVMGEERTEEGEKEKNGQEAFVTAEEQEREEAGEIRSSPHFEDDGARESGDTQADSQPARPECARAAPDDGKVSPVALMAGKS